MLLTNNAFTSFFFLCQVDRAVKTAELMLKHIKIGMILLSHFVDFNVNFYSREKKKETENISNITMKITFLDQK